MEEVKVKKQNLREEIKEKVASLSDEELNDRIEKVGKQLLEFANFMESETALFYLSPEDVFDTRRIIEYALRLPKKIVLPFFETEKRVSLWKIGNLDMDVMPDGITPNPERCKSVGFSEVDIAVIAGIALDEKGGRLGSGRGSYDRMASKIPNTARKVAIAISEQMVTQVPMESSDKYVDIIITDSRVIYKI